MQIFKRLLFFSFFISPTFLLSTLTTIENSQSDSTLDLAKVFNSCPIIYTLLILLSIGATSIWIYSLLSLRINEIMPDHFKEELKLKLQERNYDSAFEICQNKRTLASEIMASGLSARQFGPQIVLETIQSEGRRASNYLWQRINLLNDIAVLAPMLGLLGTVIGLFFGLYNTSATSENIYSIFDGLGIAIGTTVLGLIVAILAMVLQTSLKYRVVHVLNLVENESLALANFIQNKDN